MGSNHGASGNAQSAVSRAMRPVMTKEFTQIATTNTKKQFFTERFDEVTAANHEEHTVLRWTVSQILSSPSEALKEKKKQK